VAAFRFDGISEIGSEKATRKESVEVLASIAIEKHRSRISLKKIFGLSVIALAGLGLAVFLLIGNMEAAKFWWVAWGGPTGYVIRSVMERDEPP